MDHVWVDMASRQYEFDLDAGTLELKQRRELSTGKGMSGSTPPPKKLKNDKLSRSWQIFAKTLQGSWISQVYSAFWCYLNQRVGKPPRHGSSEQEYRHMRPHLDSRPRPLGNLSVYSTIKKVFVHGPETTKGSVSKKRNR